VPPGRYTLTVTKPAYLTSHYGTGLGVLPPGLPIVVGDGQRVSDLTLRLTRGGVISGVVTDAFGVPVSGAMIQVMQPFGSGNDRRLGRVVIQGAPVTDDRGVFRIFGLQPDRYIVAVEGLRTGQMGAVLRLASDPERSVTYATVYYPGTTRAADAAFVSVAAGEETTGVDVPMRLVPTARVDGMVTRADGQPMSYVQVQLVPRSSQAATTQTASGHTPEDRRSMSFVTNAVPPGEYTLIARTADTSPTALRVSPTTNPLLWAQQDLDIDSQDVSGVHLVLRPALVVTGRVVFEGTTREALYDAKDLHVLLTGVGAARVVSAQPPAEVDAEGRFAFANIVPGEYRFTASALSLPGSAPVGIWSLVSAKAGDRDLLDYPLEVRPGQPPPEIVLTYTNQTSELMGRVLDASGKPILDLSILLFTTDRALWTPGSRRVRAPARPADDGAFRFFNVPPGEYFLGVATDVDAAAAGDPSFLERLAPAAIRVTIAPGEHKVQDLRIAGPPLAAVPAGRPATPSHRAR
jgi:hypothetical protein